VRTGAQRALYNNLGKDEDLALAVDKAIQASRMDGWRSNTMKSKRVRSHIKAVLQEAFTAAPTTAFQGLQQDRADETNYKVEAEASRILDLARHQNDY
jgi:type I restriction enzyme R subunit